MEVDHNTAASLQVMRNEVIDHDTIPVNRAEVLGHKKFFLKLRISIYIDGQWCEFDIPEDQDKIVVSNDDAADIQLNEPELEDVYIVIQSTQRQWYVINQNQNNNVLINGFRKHQIVLNPHDYCSLVIGNTKMVLCCYVAQRGKDEIGKKSPPLSQPDYLLVYNNVKYQFSKDHTVFIGSDEICDIRLDGEAFVAVLAYSDRQLFITNIAENTDITIHEIGEIGKKPVPIPGSYCIEIGDETMMKLSVTKEQRVHLATDEESQPTESCMSLAAIEEKIKVGNILMLPEQGETFSVGRLPENDWALPYDKISRFHAKITVLEHCLQVSDLESHNGTFINYEPITTEKAFPGDIISFANLSYILCFS